MEKLKLHTPDFTEANIAKLAELFPDCVTESRDEKGQIKRSIDFDQLRQELSGHLVDGPQERYQLNWPGKKESLITANAPIAKTLRPCPEESVDFDTTQNLFIEGDNLEALKLLQDNYLGKVQIIYIDPPYNTGKDFIYKDNFVGDAQDFFRKTSQKDEEGNRLVANTDSNGRFHSDWLSMMYPRLKLARNLLTEDGAIFISIHDREVANLRRMCDEVFGEENYKGIIVRATGQTTGQDSGGLGSSYDFILVYSKRHETELSGLPLDDKDLERYEQQDERGKYALWQLRKTGSNDRRTDRPNMFFPVKNPDGTDVWPIGPTGYESCWRFDPKGYARLFSEDYIVWKKRKRDGAEEWWPYVKTYLEGRTKRPSPLWNDLEGSKKASIDLRSLMGGNYFDNPKPLGVLVRILQIAPESKEQVLVLDFFSGTSTTAHAVLQLNAADGGNRKFIMVQLPEPCDEESEAFRAGYKTIADTGKERIRRAGKKIKEENATTAPNLDIGFRVLKIDTSNMKDVYYAPDSVKQADLTGQVDNVREDRTPKDLLFQVMLDWGLDLAYPITEEEIKGKKVFFVAGDSLAACFEWDISEAFVKELAKRKPMRVVFRDTGYGSDSSKINVEQIFKLISPSTEVKTI